MRVRNTNVVYNKLRKMDFAGTCTETCTYSGISKKVFVYLALVVFGALSGLLLGNVNEGLYTSLLLVSVFSTFIFSLIAMLSPRASKVCGMIYCLLEGVTVGFVSIVYNSFAGGAVVAALVSTVVVFTVVTTLFVTNIVKVSSKFVKFVIIFSISFIITELLLFLLMRITGQSFGTGLSLLVSGITVLLASFYLLLDLDCIRMTVEGGYPAEYEWYAAFGLAFTLVWIYVEILRIIALLSDHN